MLNNIKFCPTQNTRDPLLTINPSTWPVYQPEAVKIQINTREVGYRNKTLFVLNDKRYEKADWETIDSIFEQTTHGNYAETKIENNIKI